MAMRKKGINLFYIKVWYIKKTWIAKSSMQIFYVDTMKGELLILLIKLCLHVLGSTTAHVE